ncbi:MAG: DNA repair protein RecN [Ignavibacteria bacterium]|nr:DNA repair protein RecN [Ignavibacteria bacterium]
MLEKLIIRNYILVKDIEINFSSGFNVITGETGAGKSIILNAIALLTGERADYSVIRTNKEKMFIEAHITTSNKQVERLIFEMGLELLGERIILRRELYTKAYSRQFINDTPVSISDLQKFGDLLIDIHSQNEHQSLLKKETHIEFLDDYIAAVNKNYRSKIHSFVSDFENLTEKEKKLLDLKKSKEEVDLRREYMEFQLKEINEVDPQENEDEELERDLNILENFENIKTSIENSLMLLYDESGSAVEKISRTEKELSKIINFDKELEKVNNNLAEIYEELKESAFQLRNILEKVRSGFNSEEAEIMRQRLSKIQFLKKKYGGSLDKVIQQKKTLEAELSGSEIFSAEIEKLETETVRLRKELYDKANEISAIRKSESVKLDREVEKVLQELGLGESKFRTFIKKGEELNSKGIDEIEFMVAVNKGSEFTPLRKTASGGEVSRIMLAIKSALAEAGSVEVLIFDEIDTGISGRIAQKAGRIMRKLSETKQIIAVTHLAQIAALSEKHFVVEKVSGDTSSEVRIRELSSDEKVTETAKLISGEKITEASLKSARELMNY